MAIERESQISIFDTMGWHRFRRGRRCIQKKNLQRMFNYCRDSSLARQFRTPITSAGCPTTRSEEFLRTIPPVCPSFGLETRIRGSRFSRPPCTCVRMMFIGVFLTSFSIDFQSIMSTRMELKPFIYCTLTFPMDYGLRIEKNVKPTFTLFLKVVNRIINFDG